MSAQAYIAQSVYYLPTNVLTNDDIAKEYPDWPPHRIYDKTGVEVRHIAAADEHVSDLATKAAQIICKMYDGICFDYLIVCTQSPDYILPTTACIIQRELKLSTNCGAIDINQGCSGFIYSLGIAKGLIETKQAKDILIINADTYSKYIDRKDKSVKTIFGDAAAATYIKGYNSDYPLIRNFVYGTDGTGCGNLICRNSGLKKTGSGEPATLYMNGPEIFNFTLEHIPIVCRKICELEKCDINDFEYVIFHQANKFMLEALRKKIGIQESRFPIMMSDTGNTVSASIPIVISKLDSMKRLKSGNKILLLGFGVGYSWAGCVVEWR